MFNVVIADDEPLALIELKSLIPWEEMGFQLIGEFRNGKSTLSFLKEHEETDLAILDINMPVMTGLQVIEESNRMEKSIEYLVVSAYGDYPLVRKAFKLGISDYIIKEELEPENLLPVLEKIANRIQKRRNTDPLTGSATEKNKRQILLDFLKKGGTLPPIVPLNREGTALVLLKLEQLHCRKSKICVNNEALLYMIEDSARRYCPDAVCLTDEDCFYLILPFDKVDDMAFETSERCSADIKHKARQYFNKLIIISMEGKVVSPEDLHRSFGELSSLHVFRSRSIRLSIEYIQDHYGDKDISFDELCDLTGTSRS